MQRVRALQRGVSWLVQRTSRYRTCGQTGPSFTKIFTQKYGTVSQAIMAYRMVERGRLNSMDYRVFISKQIYTFEFETIDLSSVDNECFETVLFWETPVRCIRIMTLTLVCKFDTSQSKERSSCCPQSHSQLTCAPG